MSANIRKLRQVDTTPDQQRIALQCNLPDANFKALTTKGTKVHEGNSKLNRDTMGRDAV